MTIGKDPCLGQFRCQLAAFLHWCSRIGGDDSKIPMIAAVLQPGASSSGHPAVYPEILIV